MTASKACLCLAPGNTIGRTDSKLLTGSNFHMTGDKNSKSPKEPQVYKDYHLLLGLVRLAVLGTVT